MIEFEPWRHYLRARMFHKLRRNERAVAEYRIALRFAPRWTRALNALGFLLAQTERWGEAAEIFTRAAVTDPENAVTFFNLGFAWEKLGEDQRAIEAFREAVRLKPTVDRAWYGMGMAYARLGQHQDAVKALEEAANLQPMNPHAWYALGMAYHAIHNPDRVKEVIHHLFRFDPRMTRQLIRDTERSDLAHLVKDLVDL